MIHIDQRDIDMLRLLSKDVDAYFSASSGNGEVRSTDIYDFIKNREPYKSLFEDGAAFNRFLRKMYKSGAFKSIITNCSVDTSNPNFYQWRFYRKTHSKRSTQVNSDSRSSQNNRFKGNKTIPVNDGNNVRSHQEKYIYDRLLTENDLLIYYERALEGESGTRFPDFTVANKITGVVYHWEHFGMDDIEYLNGVPARLRWYKDKGYDFVENGGRLIMTQYKNQQDFEQQVEQMIAYIKNQK